MQAGVHVGDFLHNVDVVPVEAPQPAQRLGGLAPAALCEQPARRLGHEGGADEQQAARDELDGKGDQPLPPAGPHGGVDAVVDPEAGEAADLPAHLVEPDEAAADGGRRQLRDVDGRDVGAAADGEAGQDAAGDDEGRAGALGGGREHDAGADEEDAGVDEQRRPPARQVAQRVGGDAARQRARLVHGHDGLLELRQLLRRARGEGEVVPEGRQRHGGADKGRVVADDARGKGRGRGAEVDAPVVDGLWRWPVLDEGEEAHCGCDWPECALPLSVL